MHDSRSDFVSGTTFSIQLWTVRRQKSYVFRDLFTFMPVSTVENRNAVVSRGCRPRIVNSENLQCIDFQRLFRSELRRFKAEIGNFVTKRRSGRGFWPASCVWDALTARYGGTLAEMQYGLRCLQNFYKYRTAPFPGRTETLARCSFMDAVLAWLTASILSAHAAPKR